MPHLLGLKKFKSPRVIQTSTTITFITNQVILHFYIWCLTTRVRWKVLGLAYVKFGTSSRWVGTQIGAGVTATLRVRQSFFGSMGIDGSTLVCCRRCPWSHGLQPISFIILVVWHWHQPLSDSLPNSHLSRISRRLGRELLRPPSYKIRAMSSANAVHSMSSADESNSVGWKLSYILSFYWVLSTRVMSTGASQVGVALFPSF